ncbi:MAG: hypothetical protein RL367_403 [Pseudomonadota bacterium]
MPAGEVALALQGWLQTQLPERRGLHVDAVTLPGNGASNLTGMIRVSWTEKDGDQPRDDLLVLRTLSPANDQFYETYDLLKQYRIIEALAQTPLKVPRVLGFEAGKSILGREFYVMHHTGGRAIPEQPPYHGSGWFAELTDAGRRKIWMEAVDSIAAIHRLDWNALGLGFLGETGTNAAIHHRFIAHHSNLLRWIEKRNGRSLPRLRRVFDWLEANFPMDADTGLLWADAKLGNLMIDGDAIVGVLDWEHCTIGPGLYDLASLMIFDEMMSRGINLPRLPGLPGVAQTVRRYEAASGRSAAHIDYFRLFSAVRLANVVCGHAPQLVASGRVAPGYEERNPAIVIMEAQLKSMNLQF